VAEKGKKSLKKKQKNTGGKNFEKTVACAMGGGGQRGMETKEKRDRNGKKMTVYRKKQKEKVPKKVLHKVKEPRKTQNGVAKSPPKGAA